MQNILYFIYRYGYVLVFVGLEFLCLNLIVNFNPHQHEIFVTSSNTVTGWFLDRYNSVSQFFGLANVANELAKENAELRSQASTYHQIYGPISTHLDSNATQQYELVAARVINNAISGLDNFFTLDVGTKDGIQKGMGVIQTNGVMGVITHVSNRYARGISILNRDSKISVAIQRNHFFGTLVWDGGDPKSAKLVDIPKHADLVEGDVIVTSGYSSKFPQGIEVGKIVSFELRQGSNFYDIELDLTNDIAKAHYVYVVRNMYASEQVIIEATNGEIGN